MNIEEIFKLDPYRISAEKKSSIFNKKLHSLNKYHYKNSYNFKKIFDSSDVDINTLQPYEELPFIPVRLFKTHDFKSVPDKNIVKTMTSSGTSGQEVSKIYLDKKTSMNQTKALVKIVTNFLGAKRMPMIIIDSPSVLKNRNMFSARGAGILGFSIFGTKKIYALDDNMQIDFNALKLFIEKHKDQKILIFGFTFMIYKYFIQELLKSKNKLDLSNSILIHGGGWKKLQSKAITDKKFKNILKELCGISKIHDYYGMVEQTGSIFMQCEEGHMHSSVFSEILIRRPYDFSIANIGEKGIIQTISLIPESYPGNSLLTEDEGILLGEDDCKCGRLGKYFKIIGRIKNAEIRGCSDTYER